MKKLDNDNLEILFSHLENKSVALLNSALLPWSPQESLKLSFLMPDLIVDSPIRINQTGAKYATFNGWLQSFGWKSNTAFVGLPGIGKSTAMKNVFTFLLHLKTMRNQNIIPIYLDSQEMLNYDKKDPSDFSSRFAKQNNLEIPSLYIDALNKILIIDGLDEVGSSKLHETISTLQEIPNRLLCIISSRIDFFYKYLFEAWHQDLNFEQIIELTPWSIENNAIPFVNAYAKKLHDDQIAKTFQTWLNDNPELITFCSNPFQLLLLLFLISNSKHYTLKDPVNLYSLYLAFYTNWCKREIKRKTSTLNTSELESAHIALARYFKLELGSPISTEDKLPSNSLSLVQFASHSAFTGILNISSDCDSSLITGFAHETLNEFFVAQGLVNDLIKENKNLNYTLQHVHHNQVNTFIRGAFECMNSNSKSMVYNSLCKAYLQHLFVSSNLAPLSLQDAYDRVSDSQSIDMSDSSERIRMQVLYYIGRLPLYDFPKLLEFAFLYEPNPLLRRSAALSAILHFNETIEFSYLDKLVQNSEDDLINRSVQLAYFGDVDADMHNFRDNGRIPWFKTKNATLERLTKTDSRSFSLRLWDLRTLSLFCLSRKNDSLKDADKRILKEISISSKSYSARKEKAVREELYNFLTTTDTSDMDKHEYTILLPDPSESDRLIPR
jgi:hypothetical protein